MATASHQYVESSRHLLLSGLQAVCGLLLVQELPADGESQPIVEMENQSPEELCTKINIFPVFNRES